MRVVSIPPARSDGLLIERVGDETVVYDLETKEAHCLKPLAALVFELSDGNATTAQIATIAQERLGTDITETNVAEAVTQLEARRLLDAPLVLHHDNGNGLSRREMVRKTAVAGAATAFAGSLITTIGAPPAFASISKLPPGCTGCGQNKDCQSNHCCQTVSGKQCNQTCCVGKDNSCHLSIVGGANICTVELSSCPCICGASGCDPTNCCPPGSGTCCTQTCSGTSGTQSTCSTGFTCCSGFCVQLANDPNNCGSCGNTCSGSTPNCVASTCVA